MVAKRVNSQASKTPAGKTDGLLYRFLVHGLPVCHRFLSEGLSILRYISYRLRAFLVPTLEGRDVSCRCFGDNHYRSLYGRPNLGLFDALFMSVLAFTTAPWVMGVIYKAIRRELSAVQVYVAICVWMFSASWSYDLYLLIRDGSYPITWSANLFASSLLYICAGLFWNLEWRPGRGVIFSFMENDWPCLPLDQVFRKIFAYALLFMILVSGMILPFLMN